jgi:hypothetical protein
LFTIVYTDATGVTRTENYTSVFAHDRRLEELASNGYAIIPD